MDHSINRHFPQLSQIPSTGSLESSPLYQRLRPEIDRVLNTVETGEDPAPGPGRDRHSVPRRRLEYRTRTGVAGPGARPPGSSAPA